MQSEFTFENFSQLDLPRFWAMVIGGMLFMCCGSFALCMTVGFVFQNARLGIALYPVWLVACGLPVALVCGSPMSTVALWRLFVIASGAAIITWPAGLLVQWFRGYDESQAWTHIIYMTTWPVVATCVLLGGFLIAVGRVAGRRSRGGL